MISPLASVDSTAKIGKNVTIQPFATSKEMWKSVTTV